MDPSKFIDREIARHPDWRGQTMAEIRRIIRETVPDVTEELRRQSARPPAVPGLSGRERQGHRYLKVPSYAARRCDPFHLEAQPRARTRAGSTSTKATTSTKRDGDLGEEGRRVARLGSLDVHERVFNRGLCFDRVGRLD